MIQVAIALRPRSIFQMKWLSLLEAAGTYPSGEAQGNCRETEKETMDEQHDLDRVRLSAGVPLCKI